MTVEWMGKIGSSFYTNSYAITKQWSETSWLNSSNDTIKQQREKEAAQVWSNVQIPNTMVATQTQIWWILDIKA